MVKLLKWITGTMTYSQDPAEESVKSEISIPETNPYDWRSEGGIDRGSNSE